MSALSDKVNLTIAIPTFNNIWQLKDCINSLVLNVEYPYKIVVVNNGDKVDRDGGEFEKSLRKHCDYPMLEVHQHPENLGWQAGVNIVFEKYCNTDFFCMMNDDLVFPANNKAFFRQLIRYFRFPEVGAIGPCTNFVMGSQNLWNYHSPLVMETTLLVGFCMIVRSQAFSEVGGLDPSLIGGDDLDLSILLRKRGYRLLIERTCYVHHIGCQTGPRVGAAGLEWNSWDHVDLSNNALIRKHGVRWWFECVQSISKTFDPVTQKDDTEGDLLREWIGDLKKGLDIGCGHNKTVAWAIGVDETESGNTGLAGGRKTEGAVTDLVADACDIPKEDGTQDFIVARHLLEHLIDPIKALWEWRRVLKPGGLLALACPDENRMNTMLMDWSHLHAYTPESLQILLRVSGFKVECVQIIDPGFSFVVQAIKGENP